MKHLRYLGKRQKIKVITYLILVVALIFGLGQLIFRADIFNPGESQVENLTTNWQDYEAQGSNQENPTIPKYEKFEVTFDIKWTTPSGETVDPIAEKYSSSQSYQAGSFVEKDGKIYKAIKDIPPFWDYFKQYNIGDKFLHNGRYYEVIKNYPTSYDNSTAYYTGDLVYNLYRSNCISDGTKYLLEYTGIMGSPNTGWIGPIGDCDSIWWNKIGTTPLIPGNPAQQDYWVKYFRIDNSINPDTTIGVGNWQEYWQDLNIESINPYWPYEENPTVNETYQNAVPARKGVSVDAILTSPSGKIITQPGFYYQDYTLNSGYVPNQDWFYPADALKWKIRFAPTEIGAYTYTIKVRDRTGETTTSQRSFTATNGAKDGFVRVSPTDTRYFEVLDPDDKPKNLNLVGLHSYVTQAKDMESYFQTLKDRGVNFIRPWWQGSQGPVLFGLSGQGGPMMNGLRISGEEHLPGELFSGVLSDSHFNPSAWTWPSVEPNTPYKYSAWVKTVGLETDKPEEGCVNLNVFFRAQASPQSPPAVCGNTDWIELSRNFIMNNEYSAGWQGIGIKNVIPGRYSSADKGANWTKTTPGGTNPKSARIRNIVYLDNQRIVTGGYIGASMSKDGGSAWENIFQTDPTKYEILSLAYDGSQYLYLGHHDYLFRVDTADPNGFLNPLDLQNTPSPKIGKYHNALLVVDRDGTITIIDGGRGGVFFSTNNGENWTNHSNGLPRDGSNYQVVNAIIQENDGDIIAATAKGIFKYLAAEDRWEEFSEGITNKNLTGLTYNKNTDDLFAISANDVYLYNRSSNSWSSKKNDIPTDKPLTKILSLTSGELIVATDGNYIYRSTDKGDSWTQIKAGLNSPYVTALTEDPDGNVQAATDGALFFNHLSLKKDLGNGQYGPESYTLPNINTQHTYFQRAFWVADYMTEKAAQYGVYMKPVIEEKGDVLFGAIQANGTVKGQGNHNILRSDNNVYGEWGKHASRIYQQYYWRYLIARFSYSTAIGAFELFNEADPYSGYHWNALKALGDYFDNYDPNKHLTSSSNWHSFPRDWTMPQADYADLHMGLGWTYWGGNKLIAGWDGFAGGSRNEADGSPGASLGFTWDTSVKHSGANSLKMTLPAQPGTPLPMKESKISAVIGGMGKDGKDMFGHKLRIAYWAKGENFKPYSGNACWQGGNGAGLITSWYLDWKDLCVDESVNGDWKFFYRDIANLDRGGYTALVRFGFSSNNNTIPANLWFDDVEIIDYGPADNLYLKPRNLIYNGGFEEIDPEPYDVVAGHSSYSQMAYNYGYGKPTVRGETAIWGGDAESGLFLDTQGIWWKKWVWANTDWGGLIEMYWNLSPLLDDSKGGLYPKYGQAYQRFMEGIPLSNGKYEDIDAITSSVDLRVLGQKDLTNNRAHLWIDNKPYTWKNVVDGNIPPSVSGTITLTGLKGGVYNLKWYDTTTGEIIEPAGYPSTATSLGGNVAIDIPPLASDIALKVEIKEVTPVSPDNSRTLTYKIRYHVVGTKSSDIVKVFVNDIEATVNESDGTWSIDLDLIIGQNTITAIGEDSSGNKSQPATYTLTRRKTADANGDNAPTDMADFSVLMSDWNKSVVNTQGDLNEDENVNIKDFSITMSYWGI